ncbi:MMPL family transporter [Candidatus Aminicenantes bacterium AC-334-K16]|mgnify:CR=1 FL=1|jgi:hypothetical protein|nr:MMPL family transporter [Candidatus Aminicenantes bacterium AC-334-K16]
MLERWAGRIIKRWWLSLLLILLITVFFLGQFKHLTYDNRVTQWIPQNDEVLKYSLEVGDKFRSNELVLILFQPAQGETFSPAVLRAIKQLTEELGQRKEIFLASSIANSAYITQIEGGIEVRDFLLQIPQEQSAWRELKKKALAEDTFVNNVISEDGQWLALNVYINPDEDLVWTFGQIIKPLAEKYLSSLGKIYYSGIPADAYFADKFVTSDIKTLVPLVIILILLILYLSFRQWGGMFYPFLVVCLASIWVFGLMGLTRTPMNIITPALPVLLVALGSAYGIHVFNKLLGDTTPGAFSPEAQARKLASVAVPVILAAGTTMVGFISFLTARLKIIIQFGFLSTIGIACASLLALIFIPAAQQLFRLRLSQRKQGISSIYSLPLSFLAKVVEKRRRLILIVSLVLFVGFFPGIFFIKHQVNFSEYYPVDSPPRQALRIVKDNFGGSSPLSLYFKTDQVKSAAFLRLVRREANYLSSLSGVSQPFSIADFIQELNYELNGSYSLPETDGQVANLWFFIEGRRELEQLVTPGENETLIMARVLSSATDQLKKIEAEIKRFLNHEFSQGIVAIDLASLPPEKREVIRRQEGVRLAEELRWITKYYTSREIPLAPLQDIFLQALNSVPGLQESEIKEKVREAWRQYIFSDDFDFYLTRAQKEKLLRFLVPLLGVSESEFRVAASDIFRRVIPEEEYETEIAADVVETFLLRRQEIQRRVYVERHLENLLSLLPTPEEPVARESLRKKAAGLLYELADSLVILPQERAGGEGQLLPLERVIQTGYPSFVTRLDYFLSTSQIQSLLLALGLTFLLIFLLNRHFLWAFISIMPIVFSVVVIYGFLGLVGIPLDFATMMIASVSIGVGIDYVIHFSHGVKEALKTGGSLEEAVYSVYLEKGRDILANSLAVMMGFLVLLFSSMSPLANFGGMMAGAMLLSATGALTILPALILWLKPEKGGQ